MRKHLGKSLIALVAAGSLLMGCAQSTDEEEPTVPGETTQPEATLSDGMVNVQEVPGDPQTGGRISMVMFTEPRQLDPAVAQAAGSNGGIELNSIYDTLMRYDVESQSIVPQLAEGVDVNDDFTEYTINLRPDVAFSDDTPLDAEAVVFSMNRYAELPTSPEGTLWRNNVDTVEAIDDLTVRITLQAPYRAFINMLATGPGMIVAQAAGSGESFEPIGAGPFVVESVAPGEATVMSANENYWDGRPYVDELRFMYLGDPQNAIEAYMAGDANAAMLRDPHRVDVALADGRPGYVNMAAASYAVMFNGGEGRPAADPRVRRAFALALDPQLAFDRAFEGKGIPTTELFPSYSQWHTGNEGVGYDPEEAARLVEELKAEGWDGKLTIDALGTDPAMATKAQLDAVGFDIEVAATRSAADQLQLGIAGDYDAATWAINIRDFDPYAKFSVVMHSEGSQTFHMPTSPEMDALIDEFKLASSDEEAAEVMAQIETAYYELLPFVSYAPYAETVSWEKNIHGVVGGASTMVYLGKAWISS